MTQLVLSRQQEATPIDYLHALKVQDLSVEFGTGDEVDRVVDQISFEIRVGETFALIGESGSGKSVTAAAILGLLPENGRITDGSIELQGNELVGLKDRQLRVFRGSHVGMIFQNPLASLDPSFKVGNQLREIIRLHRPDLHRNQVEDTAALWLENVGISDSKRVLRSYPHELSGGMRQRVMIAIASLSQPALLIADEPTTALDAVIQKQILDLLKSVIVETNSSLLIITHDFGVVSYLADRVAVMKNGRIVEQASRTEVVRNPLDDYTRTLIASVPEIGARFVLDRAGLKRRLGRSAEVVVEAGPQCVPVEPPSESGQGTFKSASEFQAPLLEVRELRKEFVLGGFGTGQKRDQFVAVDDISLSINPGEIYGLIGESGSGKSTFARLIGGLLPSTSGEISFLGRNLHDLNARRLRRIRPHFQYVFQDATSSLNPRIPVGEQIARPLRRFGKVSSKIEATKRVSDFLDIVGLPSSYYGRYPHELSGGQRQRIGIARALVLEPELLILDEPTSALDVSTQATIINLILDLRDELDLTYLFIGHNLAIIEFVCDRIGVLERGSLVDEFTAAELFASDRSEVTKSLLGAILPLDR